VRVKIQQNNIIYTQQRKVIISDMIGGRQNCLLVETKNYFWSEFTRNFSNFGENPPVKSPLTTQVYYMCGFGVPFAFILLVASFPN